MILITTHHLETMRCHAIARMPSIPATVLCLLLVVTSLVDVVSFCLATGTSTPNSAASGRARTSEAQAEQAQQQRSRHLGPLPAVGTSTDGAASSAEVGSKSTTNTPAATAAAATTTTTRGPDAKTVSSERFDHFAKFLLETQEVICLQAEASDGRASFCSDRWERDGPSEVGMIRTAAGPVFVCDVNSIG